MPDTKRRHTNKTARLAGCRNNWEGSGQGVEGRKVLPGEGKSAGLSFTNPSSSHGAGCVA